MRENQKYIQFLVQYSPVHPIMEALASDGWFAIDGRFNTESAHSIAMSELKKMRKIHKSYVGYEIRQAHSERLFDDFITVAKRIVYPLEQSA